MGFTNTKYSDTITSLVDTGKKLIETNPFLKFTDKKPTKVTYYKQNLEQSTTDETSADIYQTIGNHSSIKYNKIKNFMIYGFDRVSPMINLEMGEFGMESSEISGNAVILPKTIVPTSGDYFVVDQIEKEELLFIVNDAQSDGLEHENSSYKIEYHLEKRDALEEIERQVVRTYTYNASFEGTDFKVIMEDGDLEVVNALGETLNILTSMYQSYFDNNVQNFVYNMDGWYMYDPYMVEFMIRNKIMTDTLYISHGTPIGNTFAYDYSKTFFYLIEHPEEFQNRHIEFKHTAVGIMITEVNTLFVTRLHDYYRVEYNNKYGTITAFNIFPADMVGNLYSGTYFDDKQNKIYNILIAHLNGDDSYLSNEIIHSLQHLEYCNNKQYFYMVPICLYVINQYIQKLLH